MAVFSGNGSVGSPSFTFSSDTNSGVYRFDADKVGIAAGGALGIVVNSNGQLGVGRDPGSGCALDVEGTFLRLGTNATSGETEIVDFTRFTGYSSTRYAEIRFGAANDSATNSGVTHQWRVKNDNMSATSHDFRLQRVDNGGTTTAINVNKDGTVGIGGTLPSSPNISLNAGGSIATTGTIFVGDQLSMSAGGMPLSCAAKSLSLDGTAQDAFRLLLNNGHGAAEITVTATDSSYPNGASVQKLYLAWSGSGTAIVDISLTVEDKASINSGPAGFPGTWTATLNGTGSGNDIDLEYTGTSGQSRNLQAFCISTAGNLVNL